MPRATRVETRISHTAGWDVSIRFDPRTCEVFCEYRPKRGAWGLFLPPIVDISA